MRPYRSQFRALGMHTIVLFENMYFYCMYLTIMKIFSMLGTGYFVKIAKINSQQEKPICFNRKTQKITNLQK